MLVKYLNFNSIWLHFWHSPSKPSKIFSCQVLGTDYETCDGKFRINTIYFSSSITNYFYKEKCKHIYISLQITCIVIWNINVNKKQLDWTKILIQASTKTNGFTCMSSILLTALSLDFLLCSKKNSLPQLKFEQESVFFTGFFLVLRITV